MFLDGLQKTVFRCFGKCLTLSVSKYIHYQWGSQEIYKDYLWRREMGRHAGTRTNVQVHTKNWKNGTGKVDENLLERVKEGGKK